MRFALLGSGSAGNATLVEIGKTRLLLDCGFSLKEVVFRLHRLGVAPESLSGILITHEHDDHAKGAFKLAAKFAIPVWLTHGTYKMCARYLPDQAQLDYTIIDAHTAFAIQEAWIQPFPVPHDAREPSQFIFSDGQAKLGVLTDVGCSTTHIETMLSACDALVLECNHDVQMLEHGPYARALKKRVGGRWGHLDNQSAATLLAKLDNRRLKHMIAAHLSETNNRPVLAQQALSQVLGCDANWVGVADQHIGLDWRML